MKRLENNDGQLEVNSLADWEPMELSKDWSDVVAASSSGDQSCGSVLDSLKPLHQAVSDGRRMSPIPAQLCRQRRRISLSRFVEN